MQNLNLQTFQVLQHLLYYKEVHLIREQII